MSPRSLPILGTGMVGGCALHPGTPTVPRTPSHSPGDLLLGIPGVGCRAGRVGTLAREKEGLHGSPHQRGTWVPRHSQTGARHSQVHAHWCHWENPLCAMATAVLPSPMKGHPQPAQHHSAMTARPVRAEHTAWKPLGQAVGNGVTGGETNLPPAWGLPACQGWMDGESTVGMRSGCGQEGASRHGRGGVAKDKGLGVLPTHSMLLLLPVPSGLQMLPACLSIPCLCCGAMGLVPACPMACSCSVCVCTQRVACMHVCAPCSMCVCTASNVRACVCLKHHMCIA